MSGLEPRWARLAAETKRVMVEEIKSFEEKLKRENEALEVAQKVEAAKEDDLAKNVEVSKIVELAKKARAAYENLETSDTGPKTFNPFEGAPLPKNFPKTPQNFHKGERIFGLKENEEGESMLPPKSYNPFEGALLPKDFPKTPLNFWKGHVVGEPRIVVTDHDAERGAGGWEMGKGGGNDEKEKVRKSDKDEDDDKDDEGYNGRYD